MRRSLLFLLFFCLVSAAAHADPAFDLAGPKVDVHVKRGQVTLPIGEVSNLLPGDRLWIHPDFPDSQSARYVLVVAFLRGATNPPPAEWFTRVETWNHDVHEEGVFVTVPEEAQQAVVFLAPETGGDFNTLRNTVRGRPGAFVRAVQDLQSASWDRMRVEDYMTEVKITSQTDMAALKTRTEMAARSLGIKVNQACFDKPMEQQAACLAANPEGMVMDDTNAQSRVDQLTSGSTMDLMNQLSSTTFAGGGAYSPYVGAIVDTAKILASLHTAHFQYIPALALPKQDTLNLRLNLPPSFRDPKSVVVVALPPVGPATMPPLYPVTPSDDYCVQKPGLVLPAEGAPLVFATQLAHDLSLHIESSQGPEDLPVKADPASGGLEVLKTPRLGESEVTGVLRGKWGFDDWEGPRFTLVNPQQDKWVLAENDESALVVGRADTLHFHGESTLCVDHVAQVTSGNPVKLTWKTAKGGVLEVDVPLKSAVPGPVTLEISEYGLKRPDRLTLTAYAEAASLDHMTLNAGDTHAELKGTRLDEVATVNLEEVGFTPAHLSRVQGSDVLQLTASSSTANLDPTQSYFANVQLKDGRAFKTPVVVLPPRPKIDLLSKGVQDDGSAEPDPVTLGSADDLPVNGRLVFFLKSSMPASFPRDEKLEVAAADDSFHTDLSLTDGSVMLEDAKTAVGSVQPLVRFGPSAFGPIRVRAVAADGTTGDWVPLGTLVRMPGFKDLRCPRATAKPCQLSATNLFLATAIAATQDFSNPVAIPPDFTGTELIVPHPAGGVLYVKLRDDPATVQTLTMAVTPIALPPRAETGEAATEPLPEATAPAESSEKSAQPVKESAPTPPSNGQAAPPTTNTPQADTPQSAPPQMQNSAAARTGTSVPAASPQGNAATDSKTNSAPANGQPQR